LTEDGDLSVFANIKSKQARSSIQTTDLIQIKAIKHLNQDLILLTLNSSNQIQVLNGKNLELKQLVSIDQELIEFVFDHDLADFGNIQIQAMFDIFIPDDGQDDCESHWKMPVAPLNEISLQADKYCFVLC